MRGIFKVVVLIAVLSMFAGVTNARAVDLANKFVAGADLGFYLDPDLVAMSLMGEYHVTSNVALGPYVTLGTYTDYFYFSGSGVAKYKANLNENAKLKPYGLLGVGFLVLNEEVAGDWHSDTKFLIPVGGGFEYWVSEKLAWGGNVVFNISEDIFFGIFFGVRTKF